MIDRAKAGPLIPQQTSTRMLPKGGRMAKRKLPAALKAHQFKAGSKKTKTAARKGGRKSPMKKGY